MNERLIQNIFHINSNLERKKKASSLDNAFLFFQTEYEFYFLPIFEEVIPAIDQHLMYSKKENKEQYYKYINAQWIPLLDYHIKKTKLFNMANINICKYIVEEMNMVIEAYENKNDNEQKKTFILNFLKNKSKTIQKIMKEDFELGFKTISEITCPKVQFELIQCNKNIKNICKRNFSQMSENERLYFLSKYFCYPLSPEIDQYYILWKAEPQVHIKFCREILGEHYKSAKNFLKGHPKR